MERQEAIERMSSIVGQDLRVLADNYGIQVFNERGNKNKGWAGHVVERHLGLPRNSAQVPNFGSWELKTASLKRLRNGQLTVKETMAITMIDEHNIRETAFEESHLLTKLRRMVIVARIWENREETSSELYAVRTFDLDSTGLYRQIEQDYNSTRNTIINEGFSALTGRMGVYIQPRTKGAGHGSTSRAFYARTHFLREIFFPPASVE
jgi:DNA mismatch repair protein MutH